MRNDDDETADRLCDWLQDEPLGTGWSAAGRNILEGVDGYAKAKGQTRAVALLELAEAAITLLAGLNDPPKALAP